jgi:hypothetical protein
MNRDNCEQIQKIPFNFLNRACIEKYMIDECFNVFFNVYKIIKKRNRMKVSYFPSAIILESAGSSAKVYLKNDAVVDMLYIVVNTGINLLN